MVEIRTESDTETLISVVQVSRVKTKYWKTHSKTHGYTNTHSNTQIQKTSVRHTHTHIPAQVNKQVE